MKRKSFIILFVGAVIAGLGFWAISNFGNSGSIWSSRPAWEKPFSDEELSQRNGQPVGNVAQPTLEKLDPKRVVRVAVGNLGLTPEAQQGQVSDLLLAQLTGAKGLEFVERQAFDKVLRELRLSVSGLVRANDAVRVGKLVQADWFLLGSPVTLDGKQHVVVRVVDARTGILREAGVFRSDQTAASLAPQLGAFLRQCRQNAAEAKSRTYLAIGAFEDLSVNSRHADLPGKLRAHLIAAYQGDPNVTLLEREFASVLMQELRLDLAGLTEASATNAPAPMASAYWLVEGYYQSYETATLEVELMLNLRRMFGRSQQVAIREKPDGALFQRIKAATDNAMRTDKLAVVPTRMTEVKAQLYAGKELTQFGFGSGSVSGFELVHFSTYYHLSHAESARRRRNAEEAIRAFEAVLLLEPDHREARMYIAACLRQTYVGRTAESRKYYQEIIEMPGADKWTVFAKDALLASFGWESATTKKRWFSQAAANTANAAAKEFYQGHAERAADDMAIHGGDHEKAEAVAEARLFETIESFDNLFHGKGGGSSFALGMDNYAEFFGTNRALAAQRLTALFPKMKSRFPDIAHYLLATLLTFQVDTNSPVVGEYEQMLESYSENPEKIVDRGASFWSHARYAPYRWALEQKAPALAVKILECVSRASKRDPKARLIARAAGDHLELELAFAYLDLERWNDALVIFESYTNRPVLMSGDGPWGEAWRPFFPGKQVARCRQKLGLPAVVDSREFDMGKSIACLHQPSAFALDAEGAWIATGDHLLQVSHELKTNLSLKLPLTSRAETISEVCVGADSVWIGTGGEGLVELNKTTRQCRLWTEKDGLLVNKIAALHLDGNTLWVGYGHRGAGGFGRPEGGGGLGRMDLASRKFTSFSRSMFPTEKAGAVGLTKMEGPPNNVILGIARGAENDLWMLGLDEPLLRYRPAENVWERIPGVDGYCLAAAGGRLFLGQYAYQNDPNRRSEPDDEIGVHALNFTDRRIRKFKGAQGLPLSAVTAMVAEGKNLWVGGLGFIACLDAESGEVSKLAYVSTRGVQPHGVERIRVGGGYLWAQFDKHLYRVRLP